MNREAKFAQLLIQMGVDRGLDVQQVLAELSTASFPSFIDAGAVRASLVDAVESWWRADLEQRINQLRNQYGLDAPESSVPTASPTEPRFAAPPPEVSTYQTEAQPRSTAPVFEPIVDETIQDVPTEMPRPQDASESIPSDATVIWNTRGG